MPIRRIGGATPAPVIKVNGKDVTLWNHGTTADGINLTVKTLRPICDAINEGYGDLSGALETEKERAIQAETELSGWCDSISSKLDTVSSNLDAVSGDLIEESNRRATKDEELQSQIDTIEAATDVIDVFGTYSQFNTEWKTKYFPTGKKPTITDNDIIKIINDEHTPVGDTNPTTGHQTYYQWTWTATTHTTTADGAWDFIGFTEPYYNTAEIDGIIRDTKTELSSMVSNNYLSAKGAVLTGRNIAITEDENYPKITIATKDDVNFDTVSAATAYGSSAKFTNISANKISADLFKSDFGTVDTFNLKFISAGGDKLTVNESKAIQLSAGTLYGQSNNSNVDSLIGSAQSGAEASAYITAHSADFLNSAHNAYGTLTFGTKAYPATNSNYNFTFLAGQGIGFTTGNNQVTISAEGTTYQASSYISTANKKISVTGSLITSAEAGSAASAWVNNTLFDYSFTDSVETETTAGSIDKIKILYKNDVTDHDVMHDQEMVFSRGNYSVSGLLIQAANSNDNGKVLTYNSTANNYTWQPIPDSTYSNGDDNISIDNVNRTIGLATSGINTSAYSATYIGASGQYDSILNGQTLHFSYGHGGLDISFTGVSYYGGGSQGSTNWDNLFQNYAQVNRDKLSNSNLTADKVNFIVATGSSGTQPYKAVNFVVTASVPPILDDDVYYII